MRNENIARERADDEQLIDVAQVSKDTKGTDIGTSYDGGFIYWWV